MTPKEIETLEKIKKDYAIHDGIYFHMTNEWCVLDKAIRNLKETVPKKIYEHEHDLRKMLETIINNRWISVEEKLPEEHHAVLVYCPQQKNIYCAFRDKNEWRIFGGHNDKIGLEVVAWRLLPANPSYNLCDTNPFNDERFGG